jgi:transposase
MRRAVKLSLKFATGRKQRQIAALLEAYRAAVNFYLRSLWQEPGQLDKATLARLQQTRLSERYKSQALKQALEIVAATRKSATALGITPSCPVFDGAAVLDAKFVRIEAGRCSFDLALRLSLLKKGRRLTILTRRTEVLNKWLAKQGAHLIHGCALSESSLIVWVEISAQEPKAKGEVLAVDLGVNKLLADSNGEHYGREFKAVRDKIRRRKPGSLSLSAARREREHFINHTVKGLPWDRLQALGVEDLRDLKRGKQKGRGRRFRKAIAPWTYRHVLNRLACLAQENRVLLVRVAPANTSRTCPVCGWCEADNRKGERFCCRSCGHAADADTVGAVNLLVRTLATLGSVASPRL